MLARKPWVCAECGAERVATAHQMRQRYCSMSCMAAAYRTRMLGSANPHFKNAGWHLCERCGTGFRGYQKHRRFCSIRCRDATKTKTEAKREKEQRPVVYVSCQICGQVFRDKGTKCCSRRCGALYRGGQRAIHTRDCAECGKTFRHSPSVAKRFCSYQCHIKNGGATRAGLASAAAVRIYGAKKDANHAELVGVFEDLGVPILDLSAIGRGLPDAIANDRGTLHLVEIKNPQTSYGKRGLNKNQAAWAKQWGGLVNIVRTKDDVVALVNSWRRAK